MKWFKNRLKERTTMDGAGFVVIGLLVLFMAPLAKIVAGVAIAYGIWSMISIMPHHPPKKAVKKKG